MFTKTRYRMAYRFGNIEHKSSRICFLFMLLSLIALIVNQVSVGTLLLVFAIIFWIAYFLSHNLEKRLYPKKR